MSKFILKEKLTEAAKLTCFILSTIGSNSSAMAVAAPVPANIVAEYGNHSFEWLFRKDSEEIRSTINYGLMTYKALSELAERDFESAELAAIGMKENVIGALAIAEFIFSCLPPMSIIKTFERGTLEYNYFRAIAELRKNAKALDSLVRQITQTSPDYKSEIDPLALQALANHGAKVSSKWH